jgi:ribosomal protein S27AE
MNTHTTSCPTCDRMGRITVTREDGTLTTATCPNCNGYGVVATHDEAACGICNPAPVENTPASQGTTLSPTAQALNVNGDYVWLCADCSHAVSGYDGEDVFGYAWRDETVEGARAS